MENIILEIFSKRLKQLRESHNLSTRELGEIVGVSNATISRYETGKRDPDLMTAHNMANYFGVTIEYLTGEDISTDIESLIQTYSKLSDNAKIEAIRYITYLYEKGE
jgi:transcriptional regulator with XRE-family HTH domain